MMNREDTEKKVRQLKNQRIDELRELNIDLSVRVEKLELAHKNIITLAKRMIKNSEDVNLEAVKLDEMTKDQIEVILMLSEEVLKVNGK